MAYRTMRSQRLRKPRSLWAFGTEAVDPVKVGLKSLRIELANIKHNEEVLHLNLDLLEEKRE